MKTIQAACTLLCLTQQILAQAPTITLGPSSDYQRPPSKTPTVNSNELIIKPEDLSKDIPPEGLDVFLGSDLQAQAADVLERLCSNGYTQTCAQALAGVLNVHDALESRQVGFGATAVMAIFASLVMYQTGGDQQPRPAQPHLHIPASDLSQLQSQTATTMVFETSKGAPVVTVTTAPTETAAAIPATVTTLSTDSDGHRKGDVLITIPAQRADLLLQLIYQEGECKARPSRRFTRGSTAPDLTVATNAAMMVLYNAGRFTPLNLFDITGLPQQILHYRDDLVQAALETVQESALKLPVFAGVAADITKQVASIVWAATYEVCIDHATSLEQIAIESSLVIEDPMGDDEQDNDKKCPDEMPICEDNECLGIDGVCKSGQNESCMCAKKIVAHSQYGTRSQWDAGQEVIEAMLAGATEETRKLECDGDARVSLESADFTKLVAKFCDGADLKSDIEKSIKPADAGSRGAYTGTSFNFAWKPKDGACSNSCAEIFAGFRDSTPCSYDSHSMSVSGTQELSCGTASFKFDKPEMAGDDRAEPEPEAAPQSDLTCGFATNQGDPDTFLPLDAITKAADQFCDGIGKKKQKEAEHKEFFDFGDKKTVFVAMSLDQDASCPKFNLKDKSSVETCKREFNRIIHSCDTVNTSGSENWKQGGVIRGCVTWWIRHTYPVLDGSGGFA